MWISCLQDLFCMILYSQKLSQKIILLMKEVIMKKILLLLMVMFTFENCSFAENWVYTSTFEGCPVFTDIDSITFNKNGVNSIQKLIDEPSGAYVKYYCNLNIDSDEFTMRGDMYDKYGVIFDHVKQTTVGAQYDRIVPALYKTLYKYHREYHKELVARNAIIAFEIIAILVLLMYIKRKQKDEKVVVSEEKDSVEETDNEQNLQE